MSDDLDTNMEPDTVFDGVTQENHERADEMTADSDSPVQSQADFVDDSEATQFDQINEENRAGLDSGPVVADSEETQFDGVSPKVNAPVGIVSEGNTNGADTLETSSNPGNYSEITTAVNGGNQFPEDDAAVDSAMVEEELPGGDGDVDADDETVPVEGSGTVENHEDATHVSSSQPDTLCQLPIARIKRIMKFDPEVGLVNQEATLLVAKATELFIRAFSRQVGKYTLQCKRKTLQKKDIDEVIERVTDFEFLEGVF